MALQLLVGLKRTMTHWKSRLQKNYSNMLSKAGIRALENSRLVRTTQKEGDYCKCICSSVLIRYLFKAIRKQTTVQTPHINTSSHSKMIQETSVTCTEIPVSKTHSALFCFSTVFKQTNKPTHTQTKKKITQFITKLT